MNHYDADFLIHLDKVGVKKIIGHMQWQQFFWPHPTENLILQIHLWSVNRRPVYPKNLRTEFRIVLCMSHQIRPEASFRLMLGYHSWRKSR